MALIAPAISLPERAAHHIHSNWEHWTQTYKHENPVLARAMRAHRKFDILEDAATASDDSSKPPGMLYPFINETAAYTR